MRISKAKGIFAKGFEHGWNDKIFTKTQILAKPTSPVPTFKLADYEGIEIEGKVRSIPMKFNVLENQRDTEWRRSYVPRSYSMVRLINW